MKISDVPQSGSVAGVTSSRNRSGQYRRTRAIPVNPSTVAQTSVRATLATLAAMWRTLTSAQQAGWEAFAAAHPRTNPLGATYVLTGMQAFVGVNGELAVMGVAAVTDAPTSDTPDAPSLILNTASSTATFDLDFTPTPIPADTRLAIFCSPPRSRGVRYNSDFRFIAFQAPTDTSPATVGPDVQAKFGDVDESKRYFCRAKLVTSDGLSGPWSTVLIVDPAP